ncbi:MAG: D-alanine--D-alanine ligase [Candidatus Paceibacterota bacterium]|jgi:D-alanine-D-alanine ligase
MIHKHRIGVLRGGPSNEHEVSLGTGANILSVLRDGLAHKYEVRDIMIDRSGNWYIDGVQTSLSDACSKIDCAWNALHGTYGEDGKVQHLLEVLHIPFTGSGSIASAIGMNKILSKESFVENEIKTPVWKEINSDEINSKLNDIVKELFESFLLPAVVKPVSSGSSVGVSIVRGYSELPKALLNAASHSRTVMIEEYINGVEATCGVIENFRGEELYALPVIEIISDTDFFDYDAKYNGKSKEIVPSGFADHIKDSIHELSKKIHRALGLRHYSRSDFMIHPKRGVFAIEVNTLPGFTDESLMPKALHAVGSDSKEFVDHVIGLVLRR